MLLAPQQIQINQDFAFRGVFEELCRDLGIPLVPMPSDAHFAQGKNERRLHLAKSMAEPVFKDMAVQDEMCPRSARDFKIVTSADAWCTEGFGNSSRREKTKRGR